MPLSDWADRLLARDRDAVAPALNLADDARPEAVAATRTLLDRLESEAPQRALRIGITGAPGAGKSTLIDALVRELRANDRTVGIIAVDPSSQRSGGALLGDRMRVRSGASDEGVFLRSMAARSRLGGLADATRAGVEILAAVFDWVLVETVGVGQSESDVAHLVHSLAFVAHPDAGDSLQFIKAGILEWPDLFVVNKADLGPSAERSAAELEASLGLASAREDGWTPPVLLASARDSRGISEIRECLEAHRAHLEANDQLEVRLRAGRRHSLVAALERRYGHFGIEALGGREALEKKIEASPQPSASLALKLAEAIEAKLREG
jgi:LAO/AO transport system kinase